MALAKRLIPCLDVDAGRVVKGVNFVDIKDAGDPVEAARRYGDCLLYTSPSPRDRQKSRMPSSA